MPAAAIAIPAAIGVAGMVASSNSQRSAANKAADAQRDAAAQSVDIQRYMYDQSRADTQGQRDLFDYSVGSLKDRARSGDNLSSYLGEMQRLQNPTLNAMQLENDPIYQAQQAEAMRLLNRRAASGGKMYSSDADNAVTRNALGFMQDAYGRNVDDYNRQRGNIMDRYGMASAIDSTGYNRYLDMAKIGSGAAATAGQNAMSLGSNLGQTYTQAGNASAQAQLAGGQSNAQMWNSLGYAPMNAMSMYNMYQQPQQTPYSYGNALSSAQAPTGQFNVGQWGTTAYGM